MAGTAAGLVIGYVMDEGRHPVANATVRLNWVMADRSGVMLRIGGPQGLGTPVPQVTTNGNGQYLIPFVWDPSMQIAVGENAAASVFAMEWDDSTGKPSTSNSRGRLFPTLNLRDLLGTVAPSVSGPPELVSALKDFYASYREMLKQFHAFPASIPLLTELHTLLGRIDVMVTSVTKGVQAQVSLNGPVGLRNRQLPVQNLRGDQKTVSELLARIPTAQGGKRESWGRGIPALAADGACSPNLANAIWEFQNCWLRRGVFRSIDGVVDPGKHSLQVMNKLAQGGSVGAEVKASGAGSAAGNRSAAAGERGAGSRGSGGGGGGWV